MVRRRALIFGITGQDGAYLSRSLGASGYEVHGASRDGAMANIANLGRVRTDDVVKLHSAILTDAASVQHVVETVQPDEVYNLAGQSSVGKSFEAPVETIEGIVSSTLNILEAIRKYDGHLRFYNAASSEAFGNMDRPADERRVFEPRSPYGVAKAAAFWMVRNYREAYGLHACSGILFNHESPLRPEHFVTQKVVRGAADIAAGHRSELRMGKLSTVRDWGWAPEYVEAMRLMLDYGAQEDFVIASGRGEKLETFVDHVFTYFGLDWRKHVVEDPSFHRPLDITFSVGDPSKAAALLDWKPLVTLHELAGQLVEAELSRRKNAQDDGAGQPMRASDAS